LHPEHDAQLELALEDVFLVPQYFDGGSRLEVDLRPGDFVGGSHPVVSANMNGVTGKRMAETMARFGGLGVLPQDMELKTVERIVRHLKAADARYDTAVTVTPEATLRDVLGLIRKRSHEMVVVIDEEQRPIGLITTSDLRDRDQYTPARDVMSRRLSTLTVGVSNREAYLFMDQERVRAARWWIVRGGWSGSWAKKTRSGWSCSSLRSTPRGELMVAAAIGISAEAPLEAAQLKELGVDCLVLDTAHGHQRRMVEAVAAVKKAIGNNLPIVAGNVCTVEGTRALCEAGADVVEGQRWARGDVHHPDADWRRPPDLFFRAARGRRGPSPRKARVGRWRRSTPTRRGLVPGRRGLPGDDRHGFGRHLREPERHQGGQGRPPLQRELRDGELPSGDETAPLTSIPLNKRRRPSSERASPTSRIYLKPGMESVGAILVDIITGLQSAFTYVGALGW
jgi:IMP dehydrogenase